MIFSHPSKHTSEPQKKITQITRINNIPWNNAFLAMANAFRPTAVVGEADSVNSVLAPACHIGGPKGVSPGQKVLHCSAF